MRYLVKVRVNSKKLIEFGQKLQNGELERNLIISDTYCLAKDPEVGYSVWEAQDRNTFNQVFEKWKNYYSETDVIEVITANESMKILMQIK
jgi:hypothetical protein